jgi:hypothetical protein
MTELPPLAVHRRRTPGGTRIALLDDGQPPLGVVFEIPDSLASAEIEAAASEALSIVRRTPAYLSRYGLAEKAALTDLQVAALARVVTAIEAAIRLWKDWNYAEPDAETGEAVRSPLNPETIAHVLSSANLRAAWMIHLDAASPVERAEGNVFAVSPDTISGEAADTVATAESETTPAAADSPEKPDGSAPL